MTAILIIAAVTAAVTQLLKRYVGWAKANPKVIVLVGTAIGAAIVWRVIGVAWLWTFGLSALCAVGIYEFLIKPLLTPAP